MEYYFARYGDLELQRRMVSDSHRTRAFAQAIASVVRKGDLVLDVGTGTGILAMLAARAGAKKVWAIDQAEVSRTAANLVKANGLQNKVKILRGLAADLELPKRVDVLVSEWLGNFAFVESMMDDVLLARDANLAEGGVMLPSHVAAVLAPVDDSYLYFAEGPGYWRNPIEGLDFSQLEALEIEQGRVNQLRVEPTSLLAEGADLVEVDLLTANSDSPWTSGRIEFEVVRDGVLTGFCGWFRAQLAPDVVLDTSPRHPETHWSQSYFPFPPRRVRKGSKVTVEYTLDRDPAERRYVQLYLKIGRARSEYRFE